MPTEAKAHVWERDELDYYVEPEWCDRRLFEVERFNGHIVDPACGSGRIVRAAEAAGHFAIGRDIVQRGPAADVVDFFSDDRQVANIVSNPPFGGAVEFIEHALSVAVFKVIVLLPTTFLHSDERAEWFHTVPLRRVWIMSPRPSMPPGSVIEAGEKPGGGKKDFAWFVFVQGTTGAEPVIRWLRRDGGPDGH